LSLGGGGSGLFRSVEAPTTALCFSNNVGEVASSPAGDMVGSADGTLLKSIFPCLVFGTEGFCRAWETVLTRLRRSSSASSGSNSCDVRGVSVDGAGIGSKIDWRETDAESALLLLLSPTFICCGIRIDDIASIGAVL